MIGLSVDPPSVLIFSAVRTNANSVALKVTVPSLFRGMFMETSLWRYSFSTINNVSNGLQVFCTTLDFLGLHLAGNPMWTEFAKAQRRRDPPQQGDHIKVLYPSPADITISRSECGHFQPHKQTEPWSASFVG